MVLVRGHTTRKITHWIRIFFMLTIAELLEYIRHAEKLLSASERNELAELVDVLVHIWLET